MSSREILRKQNGVLISYRMAIKKRQTPTGHREQPK